MKKALKFGSPVLTIALFVLAGILLLGSSIGGARAALTYYSETYNSQIELQNIGVALLENDEVVSLDGSSDSNGKKAESSGVLLANLLEEGETLKIGKTYPEAIAAKNTGDIDEYVRITLYTYWTDADGSKQADLDPGLIELNVPDSNGWQEDVAASTKERKVYYYTRILESGENGITSPLTDKLTISGKVVDKATTEESDNVITVTYDYDGKQFVIEAVVDAVQTHNAEDAIWSAWGRKVSIDAGGNLHLNN